MKGVHPFYQLQMVSGNDDILLQRGLKSGPNNVIIMQKPIFFHVLTNKPFLISIKGL